jgi:hypothetical protein
MGVVGNTGGGGGYHHPCKYGNLSEYVVGRGFKSAGSYRFRLKHKFGVRRVCETDISNRRSSSHFQRILG